MTVMNEIAEARASAVSLRASAQACSPEQGPRAAESLDAMVLLAVRGIGRVEELEQELRQVKAGGNALTFAGGATLDTGDLELILRALDVLDRLTQDELASKQQDAELIGTWSRLLIVRAKVSAMQVSP